MKPLWENLGHPKWVRAGHPLAAMTNLSITGIRAWFHSNQWWECRNCKGCCCATNTPLFRKPKDCLRFT